MAMHMRPPFPSPTDPLNDLQCRYDGPPPRPARAAALAGGPERLAAQHQNAARRLSAERCAQAWQAVVLRRAALAARQVRRDRWLARLVDGLMAARMRALRMEADHLMVNTARRSVDSCQPATGCPLPSILF